MISPIQPERLAAGDQASLNGGFDAVRIGEAPDREGRRKPGLTLEFGGIHTRSAVLMAVMMTMIVVMVMIMSAAAAFAMFVVIILVVMVSMIMMVMVMTVIMMAVIMMRVLRLRVGPAFGIKSRFDRADLPAEPLHHRLDHVIGPNAQALPHHLNREVTVSEMPGEAQQMFRACRADLNEFLGGAHHLDDAAIFELQRVARAQGDGFRQIKQKIQPADTLHREPPTMAIVKIQHDRIRRIACPVAFGDDFGGADHGRAPVSV